MRLDANFRMLWTITGARTGSSTAARPQEVTFEVQVRTHGYIGLGFSTNGELAGADVAIGWIHQGQPYFQVREMAKDGVINNVCVGVFVVARIAGVGGAGDCMECVAHVKHM